MRAHPSSAAAFGVVFSLLGSCTNPESPSERPQIAIAPSSLAFTTMAGVDPAPQSVALANSGAGELVWSISDDAGWLSVSPAAGAGGATVTVSVAVAGLAVGNHTASLTVTADGASNSPRTVGVTLTITEPPPTIAVTPASLTFSGTQGGANPDPQTISISNGGGGTLTWTASDDASWLSLSSASGTGAATVTVSVNTTGLAPGTHNGSITIAATGAVNTPATVAVTLTVAAPPPTIGVAPASLSFSGTQGGANPDAQSIAITNDGGGTLDWTASDDAAWLSLSSASGTGASTVTVSVNSAGLAAGTHIGTITIAATGATNTPRTVAVTLTLTANYNGAWAGTTAQDSTITMQISNNAITQISFGFRIASCGVSGRTTTTFNTPVNVASGNLSQSAGAAPLSYSITGTFSSSTAVAGTLTLNWSQGGCSSTVNTTWSATRP